MSGSPDLCNQSDTPPPPSPIPLYIIITKHVQRERERERGRSTACKPLEKEGTVRRIRKRRKMVVIEDLSSMALQAEFVGRLNLGHAIYIYI
jgi:hypothetical protein